MTPMKKLFGLLMLAAAALAIPAWAQNAPIGNRDGITPSGSTFFTWGWTCDPDSWSTPLAVHFYIDGTYETGTFAGAVTANEQRNDVFGVCGGTTAHGYGFYIPSQFMSPGTHSIYAYAIDSGGAGPNPLLGGSPLSYTVSAPAAPPSCNSARPQAATTTATSGAFELYADGVQNATAVYFPTWADASQRDIVWYPGTNLGNGTWKASVNLGQHFAGNPIYGAFNVHVYAQNPSFGPQYCAATSFQRVQVQQPTCVSSGPQASTTTATSGPFDVFAYGVQNATGVYFPTWADPGQRDIVWYPGTNLGNGTWKASVDLGRHFPGNPIYGQFYTHVYVANASVSWTYCSASGFVRQQAALSAASFESQVVPAQMAAGQTYNVQVVMRNTGTTTWTSQSAFNLGSVNPHDNLTWGRNRVPLPRSVAPNESVTFSFQATAPSTPGTYNFQWAMVQDGVAWFGNASQNVPVQVSAPSAYSIAGRTGTPGATVMMGLRMATADADGAYIFTDVSPGTYVLSVSQPGGACKVVPSSLSVNVNGNVGDANFTTQCERSWDPLIRNAASHYRECDQNGACSYWGQLPQAWAFSNSNEVPAPPSSPTHPAASIPNWIVSGFFTKAFVAKGDGTHKVVLGLDKDSNPNGPDDNNILVSVRDGSSLGSNAQVWLDTTFSTAFVEDNFDVNGGHPSLAEELWVDVRAALTAHRVSVDPQPMPPAGLMAGFPAVSGMSRLTVGVTAEWGGNTRFLEVVLWDDAAYDSCINGNTSWWGMTLQSPCDPVNLYERRSSWGSGEAVYFYATSLPQVYAQIPGLSAPSPQPLGVGGTNSYSLPIKALFQWYFGGRSDTAAPGSWADARIKGVYLGIETWGRARTFVEIDNYRLYAVRR